MTLSFNEVHLTRLKEADINLLRHWRNDKKIAKHMFYQEYISEEMQQQWFNSISDDDYYFIITYKNDKIGLIDLKLQDTIYYAGLFIYDENLWGTPIPVYASLELLRFAFENLKLKFVYAKVRMENKNAIAYNQFLGFKVFTDTKMRITSEEYWHKTKKLHIRHHKKTS